MALGLVFVVAFLGALLLTPLSSRIGIAVGLVDTPRPGELQRRPVPRSGGYAVFAAFFLAVAASLLVLPRDAGESWRLIGLGVGALLLLPLAVIDDLRRLGPAPQLVGQIVVAVSAIPFGIVIDSVANPFGELLPLPAVVAFPLTVVWIVGMINTINFIDTMDGLASGIAAIAAVILLVRSVELGQWSIAVLPLALLGACAGFLPFNFHPARVILGTSGSMLLGYALAMLAIFGGAKLATAVMVLGLPIVDVALVIVQRLLRGRSPFQGGDGAHLPHQLVRRGWSQPRVAIFLYACCAVAGWLALSLSRIEKLYVFGGVAIVLIAVIAALTRRTRQHTDQQIPNPQRGGS